MRPCGWWPCCPRRWRSAPRPSPRPGRPMPSRRRWPQARALVDGGRPAEAIDRLTALDQADARVQLAHRRGALPRRPPARGDRAARARARAAGRRLGRAARGRAGAGPLAVSRGPVRRCDSLARADARGGAGQPRAELHARPGLHPDAQRGRRPRGAGQDVRRRRRFHGGARRDGAADDPPADGAARRGGADAGAGARPRARCAPTSCSASSRCSAASSTRRWSDRRASSRSTPPMRWRPISSATRCCARIAATRPSPRCSGRCG